MMDYLSLTLYITLSAVLLACSLQRPIWAVGYYMLNYFAQPPYWEWGEALPAEIRWSLIAGCVVLVSVSLRTGNPNAPDGPAARRTGKILLWLLANATLVHLLLATNRSASTHDYIELVKFVVLYFLLLQSVKTADDFRKLMFFLGAGVAYWGFQAKFGNIDIVWGRLENFGGPGCYSSNELASALVTLLPVVGAIPLVTKGWTRIFFAVAAVGGLNVLILCNSRGGFLAVLVAALMLPMMASGAVRKRTLRALAFGTVAGFLLLGNPEIVDRFWTTFMRADDASRDTMATLDYESAQSRINLWLAGLSMLRDHPLGSGGDSFKFGVGDRYMAETGNKTRGRSVHQGFLREACDWGIQGLTLHLLLIGSAGYCAWRVARQRSQIGDDGSAFLGLCVLAGMIGWLVTCLFGDLFHLEWGYWITAIAVIYSRVYGVAPEEEDEEEDERANSEIVWLETEDPELEPAPGGTRSSF